MKITSRLKSLIIILILGSVSIAQAAQNFFLLWDSKVTQTNQYYDSAADKLWSQVLQSNMSQGQAQYLCSDHHPFNLKSSTTGGQSVAHIPSLDEWNAMNARDTVENSGISTSRYMWTSTRYYPVNTTKIYYYIPKKSNPTAYQERSVAGADVVCVTNLPKYDNNNVADAPVFVRSITSTSDTKTNTEVAIAPVFFDLNDEILKVQARYKEQNSNSWTEVDLSLQSPPVLKRTPTGAFFGKKVVFIAPGDYEIQFRATSIDGSSTADSAWTTTQHTIHVVKDGAVTPPVFSGGGKDAGLFSGDLFRFKASFTEHDFDPHIISPQMRIRPVAGAWEAPIDMDVEHISNNHYLYVKTMVLNKPAGDYEVQFRATSTDVSGTETAQSTWSVAKPFLIKGITPPRVLNIGATTDGNPIGANITGECSLQDDDGDTVTDATLEYRKNGGSWVTKTMSLKKGGTLTNRSFRSTFASVGEGFYEFRCKGMITTSSGQTAWSNWSNIISRDWVTIVPNFKTLTVVVTGNGKIISNPQGINCPTDCSEEVVVNRNFDLTAIADAGSTFLRWEEACASRGSNVDCTIRVDQNRTVTAIFEKATVHLNISKSGTASAINSATITSLPAGINCGSDCSNEYDNGANVSLTCSPDAGYECTNWVGAPNCFGNRCQLNITTDTNVRVNIIKTTSTEPVVNSISPLSALLGVPKEFCFKGKNLHPHMGFHIDDCDAKTEVRGNSTERCWQCIPSFTTGIKNGVVKDAPGGNELFNFKINVSENRGISYLLGNPANNALSTPTTGFGVNAVTGNFYHKTIDANMPGKAIPFTFSRSYNSLTDNKDSFGNPLAQPLGSNWTHSYNIQLAFNSSNNQAEVIWGDGQREGFNKNGATWEAATPGNFSVLTPEGSGWQIETQSHIRYLFDANGRLTAIKRAYDTGSGDHAMLFSYNASDELTTITDTAGRVVELEYDANHRLIQLNLPGSTNNCHGTGKRTVKYFYAADGRLRNVKGMNCVDHFYTYSPSTMQIHWAGASEASLGNKSSMKLKVTFDANGRVSQQETGQNLTTNNGKYLFTWGDKTLTYQTPTGADNAVFNRDNQKRVTSITRAGKTKSISYVVDNGPESILPRVNSDYENHDFTSTYTNTDLTELKLPDNRKQTMAYNNHDLTSIITENELRLSIGRNNTGKTTSIVATGTNINANQKPSYTLAYATGDLLNLVTSATPNGMKTKVVSHHIDGQPLEVHQYIDATHFITTKYTYDAAGRRTSIKDQRGTLSCFYYDDEDNLIDTVRGLTGANCPTSPPNASVTVRRTHREYDAENRLTKIVQGFGSTQAHEKSYQYNATTGDLARTCGSGGRRCTEFHYDLDSKVEWSIRPDTRKDRFYELASGRIQITRENANKFNNAFDRIVRAEYDGNGSLVTESSCVNMQQAEESTSDCAAHSVRKRIIRDSLGRPSQIQLTTDIANDTKRVFKYSYSANGLVTTVSAPEGQITIFTRDAIGNLISVVEKNGTQTLTATYEYDGDGRLIKTTSPDGLITVYSYDGLGRKLSKIDLTGTTTWIYDDTAGTVRTRYSDGSYIDVSTNRLGQVTSKTTSDGINISYTYDALGRLDVESWSGSGGTGSRNYDYTAYNEIDKITGPFGKVVDYSWDNVNRLTKITFDTYAINTLYNGLDEVRKMITPAGNFEFGIDDYTGALLRTTYPVASGLETIFKRNSLGELTQLTTKKGSTVITNYDLALDGLGRRSSIVSEQPLAPHFGNQNLTLLLKTSGVNKGLIDKINGTNVDYDGRGNITALPLSNPINMTYDGLNRLTQAGTAQHKYDAGRNRIETLRTGKTIRYLLDTSSALPDVLASMDDQNKVEKLYIHGPSGLLAEVKKDGTTRFVHQDFNHNVVALTDNTGSVVSSYAYTPFGTNAGISGDTTFPFRFAGGVGTMTDPEGIMYMRARYYHPGIQQFTSSDLILGSLGRPQSLNRYAYVEGMALGGVDPSGLRPLDLGLSNFFNARLQSKEAEQRGESARLKLRLASQLGSYQSNLKNKLMIDAKVDFIHERNLWNQSSINFERSINDATFVKQQSGNAAQVVSLFMSGGTSGVITTVGGCIQNEIEAVYGERGFVDATVNCGLDSVSLKADKYLSNHNIDKVSEVVLGTTKDIDIFILEESSRLIDGGDPKETLGNLGPTFIDTFGRVISK